jgi:hypothetical protein
MSVTWHVARLAPLPQVWPLLGKSGGRIRTRVCHSIQHTTEPVNHQTQRSARTTYYYCTRSPRYFKISPDNVRLTRPRSDLMSPRPRIETATWWNNLATIHCMHGKTTGASLELSLLPPVHESLNKSAHPASPLNKYNRGAFTFWCES